MKRFLIIALAAISSMAIMAANKNTKTIHVTPDKATIYINGSEVGTGTYTYKFDKNSDFIILKFTAPGYIERTVRLMRENPQTTVSYKLYADEAMQQSVGSSDGVDMANKWMQVTCKAGMTEDKVWRRLMSVAVDNFENVEVRDKEAGWIKTAWKDTHFESGQTVRTRFEVRIINGIETEEISYKVRLSSEINWDSDCIGEQCYEKYPRVLRKFYDVINDLQSSLGAN